MKKSLLLLAAASFVVIPMTAQTGNTVREDLNQTMQTSYIVNDSYIWEYKGERLDGYFTYRMRFDGTTFSDGKLYHVLKTYDGRESWYENPEAGFVTSDIENGLTFLMREEDGKVYLHAPVGSEEEGYTQWSIDDHEALLYDFNAQEGESMTVIGSSGHLLTGKVTSIISANADRKDYMGYTIKFDHIGSEFTVMRDMGNVSIGCLPYFLEDQITGQVRDVAYVPIDLVWQELHRVVDVNSSHTICEKDSQGRWPWESTDSVQSFETDSPLSFDGKTISAANEFISVYILSGNAVAKGFGEVSTESLQPGVYVAKAGAQTLKIIVR